MATSGSKLLILSEEFENWLTLSGSEAIYLLESEQNKDHVTLLLLLASEYEFQLKCPCGYPETTERFEAFTAESSLKAWLTELNKFLHDESKNPRLADILSMAEMLHVSSSKRSKTKKESEAETESEIEEEEEEVVDSHNMCLSDDEGCFTTDWELKIARKKKRWCEKEQALREELKRAKLDGPSIDWNSLGASRASPASGSSTSDSRNLFTSYAASGVLINDLVKIMQFHEENGFDAEPIDDNIYHWCVKMYNFEPESQLAKDLEVVQQLCGYNHIELVLDFTIDLYPFYPPLLKVIRPRLQGAMMQLVPNMEKLKLSYWNPTKDMMTLLKEIKHFLQQLARLEATNERNNRIKFPNGSYVPIENDLLKLSLVSEINPRANNKYHVEVDRPPELRFRNATGEDGVQQNEGSKKVEYWAAGVGYGHNRRPEWDISSYLAAQKEKDKQIELVLHSILQHLKELYAKHAPQLRPTLLTSQCCDQCSSLAACQCCDSCTVSQSSLSSGGSSVSPSGGSTSTASQTSSSHTLDECTSRLSEPSVGYGADSSSGAGTSMAGENPSSSCVDPVEDMYNILEGSALIPFAEQYMGADSFLEICRHTVVYKAIIDIIREIAMQKQLVPLLGQLPDQRQSVYMLLKQLQDKATSLLQHICKAGNGHVPKPPRSESPPSHQRKQKTKWTKCMPDVVSASSVSTSDEAISPSSEEKLAREFQILFKDVCQGFKRAGVNPEPSEEQEPSPTPLQIPVSLADRDALLEEKYIKALSPIQFDSCDIELTEENVHKYAKDFQKQSALTQAKLFRIAQEVTSLATSLPLSLRSSIFVRTDDEKLTLMRALIMGPEGTPYAHGCFLFDVFFPPTYPDLPPKVNLQTTGNGSVRFNPNLYNCGKVCLSLLGTWEGQGGERWNPATSTLLQVLVSIQSLILVPEPYFNEPGYEQEIGTTAGKRNSAEYNSDVRINNIKYAIVAQLKNPSPGFEDVIKTHFYIKKERLLQEVEGWLRTDPSAKLERAYENLKSELAKLKPLPNVANILQDCEPLLARPAPLSTSTLVVEGKYEEDEEDDNEEEEASGESSPPEITVGSTVGESAAKDTDVDQGASNQAQAKIDTVYEDNMELDEVEESNTDNFLFDDD